MTRVVVLMASPNLRSVVLVRSERARALLEEHDDEDDDENECSHSDADTHVRLLPGSMLVRQVWWLGATTRS
jgi:hypothetical protein